MKILFVGDIHFKYLSQIPVFSKADERGLTLELKRALNSIDFVCNTIAEYRPDLVVLLGDVFHSLNVTQNIVISAAMDRLWKLYSVVKEVGSELYVLNGNHDYINKNYSMIDVCPAHRIIKKFYIEDNILFVPYFEPEVDMINFIHKNLYNDEIKYIVTHANINGFRYNNAKEVTNGVHITDDVDKVIISGHIHIPQFSNNVIYVGSLYQNSISEFSEKGNGVVLYDTKYGKYNFYRNYYVKPIKKLYLSSVRDVETLIDYSAVKIIIDVDLDKDQDFKEYFEYLTKYLKEVGIPYYVQKLPVLKEKKFKEIEYAEDYKEMLKRYVEHKYSHLYDIFKELMLEDISND
jgi:DNA repair exonuclease SbcCD nuclease subunit